MNISKKSHFPSSPIILDAVMLHTELDFLFYFESAHPSSRVLVVIRRSQRSCWVQSIRWCSPAPLQILFNSAGLLVFVFFPRCLGAEQTTGLTLLIPRLVTTQTDAHICGLKTLDSLNLENLLMEKTQYFCLFFFFFLFAVGQERTDGRRRLFGGAAL